jgi:hypothetical protein
MFALSHIVTILTYHSYGVYGQNALSDYKHNTPKGVEARSSSKNLPLKALRGPGGVTTVLQALISSLSGDPKASGSWVIPMKNKISERGKQNEVKRRIYCTCRHNR